MSGRCIGMFGTLVPKMNSWKTRLWRLDRLWVLQQHPRIWRRQTGRGHFHTAFGNISKQVFQQPCSKRDCFKLHREKSGLLNCRPNENIREAKSRPDSNTLRFGGKLFCLQRSREEARSRWRSVRFCRINHSSHCRWWLSVEGICPRFLGPRQRTDWRAFSPTIEWYFTFSLDPHPDI